MLGPSASDGNQNYQADKWQIDNESEKFSMTQALQVDFMKGLYLRTSMNWYYSDSYYENFTKDYEQSPGVFNKHVAQVLSSIGHSIKPIMPF